MTATTTTCTQPIGWMVVEQHRNDGSIINDWDGLIHVTRDQAEDECRQANSPGDSDGEPGDCWRVVAVHEAPPAAPLDPPELESPSGEPTPREQALIAVYVAMEEYNASRADREPKALIPPSLRETIADAVLATAPGLRCPACEWTPSGLFAHPCPANGCPSCGHLRHDTDECVQPDPATGWCECETDSLTPADRRTRREELLDAAHHEELVHVEDTGANR